ncbi:hypothetical protein [Streptomyces sp. NPDC058751]|uniref:hypothetical protein n=1 Tax=Streptomyces sp. NPDC058751 TaxID=3346623 RepID=UPI00369CB1E6
MTPAGVLRRLSGTEAACAYRHALTGGRTQAATRLTVAAVFSPAYVERAVARWARGFRALSLRIVEEGGSLWFHEVPGFAPDQLRQEMRTASGPHPAWDLGSGAGGLPASGAGDVLTAGGPLWRLGVGHDPAAAATHLLLTCHPALCDGPSTARLLRALLDALLGQGAAGCGRPGYRQDPAPDADELTYRAPPPPYPGTGMEPIPGAGPVPPPRTPLARRAAGPKSAAPGPGATGTVAAAGGAGGVVPVSLTARQSARLTAWCGRHRISAGQFFAAALADSCARAAGEEEVALLTAVSLRGRYAESVRVSEVGCFVNVVRATVRAGDGGALVERARAYGLAVRAADAAWRPVRQDHARIRRAVEDETAASGGGLVFRVAQEGYVDTVLGHHAALVTRYGTTPYGAVPHPAGHAVPDGAAPYVSADGTNGGYGAAYGTTRGAAVRGAVPRPPGVLHLSRFRGALTLSLGMPGLPESGAGAGTPPGDGGLTAPEIAAELTARALDLVA